MRDKTVLVTGAGSGIGQATARRFAAMGKNLVLIDARLDGIEDLAAELGRAGTDTLTIQADVCKREQIDDAFATAIEHFGTVDIAVNSAGIAGRAAFLDMEVAQWQTVIDVNLLGTFHVSQVAARWMVKAGHGHVVAIASGQGVTGLPGGAHYAVSKAGVIALVRSIAKELRPKGVFVHVVSMGATDTPLYRSGHTQEQQERAKVAGELTSAEDVASLIVYAASDEANWLAGHLVGRS